MLISVSASAASALAAVVGAVTGNDGLTVAGVTALAATVLGFALKWRVQASKEKKTEHESLTDLNDRLGKRLSTVEHNVAECERKHRECEENRRRDRDDFERKHNASEQKIRNLFEDLRGLRARVELGKQKS